MKLKSICTLVAFSAIALLSIQVSIAQNTSPFWSLAGNSNAATTSKLGTTNAIPLRVTTNNKTRVFIDASGKVGIGTTTPRFSLDVLSTASGTSGYASIIQGAGQSGVIRVQNSSLNGWNAVDFFDAAALLKAGIGFGNASVSGPFGRAAYFSSLSTDPLVLGTDNTIRLFVNGDNGKTGINVIPLSVTTQFNDATLQVRNDGDDNIRLVASDNVNDWSMFSVQGATGSLELYRNGSFRGAFDPTTGAYSPISDARLKMDVLALPDVLEKVMKLRPKKYHFKQNDDAKNYSYGFIAQEVKEVFPEFVTPVKDRKTGEETLTLNYNNFGVVAIKAIQEQQKQIDEQKKEIDELKETLKQFKASSSNSASQNNAATAATLSSASLDQNIPNPLTTNTSIHYTVPAGSSKAELAITDSNGNTVKQISLNNGGKGVVNIEASGLSVGTYSYTLIVDGKKIDTKKMVIVR